jgi:hypothetical protein
MEIVASAGYLGVSGVFSREMERFCANKKAEPKLRSVLWEMNN